MFDTILIIIILALWFTPFLVIYWLAWFCENPSAAKILKTYALGGAVYLLILIGFLTSAHATCSGSALYGYTDCILYPTVVANSSLLVFFVSMILLVLIGLVCLLIAAFLEWKSRRV